MPLGWSATGTISAPFTPSALPDIWEWWEPRLEGLANNDPLTTLTGQVSPGTGHNWVTGDPATYLTNQINGLGAAQFTAANGDVLLGVNPSALTAAHVFFVAKGFTDSQPGSPWGFGTAANAEHFTFSTDSKIYSAIFSSTRHDCGNPLPPISNWNCAEVVSTSSEWTYLLNGNQLFTTGTNTVASPSSCSLGARDSLGNLRWNGYYAGLYISSAKLSSANRTLMVNYLNSTFGLSIV